ncbi:aldo/keto reductase [Alkalibacter rhizosphaerae]|uniref:Aldo/keto reductase n=1 Tax=Alkalibacter rhizosphaerae TaxID=2815577 RepID=A0A974XEV0_9FIRM|nr:aldo/keto reductase [Alkalibacter rhizosphaerae]QSX08564.1 aldo/keto reductase [Alkalibacter rhizosphaerae]
MKKLGFGYMRLPLMDDQDKKSFDFETLNAMVDAFMDRGFTYFDTAYVYHDYQSEKALRESLVKRYPRESFTVATKLPMRDFHTKEEMGKIFNEQLENCGVDYFDYYMLHNIGHNSYKKAVEFDSFDFGFQKKKEGKVKKFGFSFHETPELLEEIFQKYPGLDFVQLQLNYVDWDHPNIQSRRCLELANQYEIPVIVMEPIKGGNLVQVPEKAEMLMKTYDSNASIPSWALRFAASQKGVFMVLSGMNAMEQIEDNMNALDPFIPLNEREYSIIGQVVEAINEYTAIDCTTCGYCEKECPQNIAIPDYFSLYNSAKRNTGDNRSSQFVYYMNLTATRGKASDCIECRKCESACPQHLEISQLLKDVAAEFEKGPGLPSRK